MRVWLAGGDCRGRLFGPFDTVHTRTDWLCPDPSGWGAQAPCLRSSSCVGNISGLQKTLLIICLYWSKRSVFLWRDCMEFLRKVRRLNCYKVLYQNKSFSEDDTELIVWGILIHFSRCLILHLSLLLNFMKACGFLICYLSFCWAASWIWLLYTTFIKLL